MDEEKEKLKKELEEMKNKYNKLNKMNSALYVYYNNSILEMKRKMVIEVNKRKIELEKEMIKKKNRKKLKCDICSKYKFYDLNQIKNDILCCKYCNKMVCIGCKNKHGVLKSLVKDEYLFSLWDRWENCEDCDIQCCNTCKQDKGHLTIFDYDSDEIENDEDIHDDYYCQECI